jgi:ubiquinone/menaquinone biosynthesis C-methylase UbiE
MRVWNTAYTWDKDGDEWSQQAEFCGVPYEKWKDQIRRTFIVPRIRPESVALEIGPGHGRWSVMLPAKVTTLHLVDLSQTCIDYCKHRLAEHKNIQYHVNDGKSLPTIEKASIDFVWSFDSFVHIEEPEVRSYAREFARVMKPQSMGAIHHPGSPTPQQRQNGMRSALDSKKFATILGEAGLHVIRQVTEWEGGCNFNLTGDAITVFARP